MYRERKRFSRAKSHFPLKEILRSVARGMRNGDSIQSGQLQRYVTRLSVVEKGSENCEQATNRASRRAFIRLYPRKLGRGHKACARFELNQIRSAKRSSPWEKRFTHANEIPRRHYRSFFRTVHHSQGYKGRFFVSRTRAREERRGGERMAREGETYGVKLSAELLTIFQATILINREGTVR